MHRLGIIFIALCLIAAAYFSGIFEVLFSPQHIKQSILDLGVFGPLAFIAAITLLNPYFVPVITFAIPAGLIWDFYTFFFLIWLGIIGSCIHGFIFARYFACADIGVQRTAELRFAAIVAGHAHWRSFV